MKKLSALAALLACLFVITFYACKKDKDLTRKSGEVAAPDETSSSSNFYSSGISVNSTYGFLVFDSINTFDNFCSFATTSTHAEVQAYLDSLGFVSMGHTLFTGTILEDTVTEAELPNYVLEENSIVKIQGLILKPIDSYRFVLAVRQDYFDSNSYRDLVDGDYNSSKMNQFATDQDTGFNLLTYMATTPVGHQETSLTYSG